MAWTESGIYVANLVGVVTGAAAFPKWTLSTNKFYLTGIGDTPDFTQVAASAIYSVTNEVSGTNWAAGGLTTATLAAGGGDITTAATVAGKVMNYGASNVSVANTTISTAAYGGFFYVDSISPKGKLMGIWFGGSGYTTVAGTFAITWSGGLIATITCAA
jgi:hypothetical protein